MGERRFLIFFEVHSYASPIVLAYPVFRVDYPKNGFQILRQTLTSHQSEALVAWEPSVHRSRPPTRHGYWKLLSPDC